MDDVRNFEIEETETGYRVKRIDNKLNQHTHLKNKQASEDLIKYVCQEKIPKNTGFYYLTSLIRLSVSENYIKKIEQLIETRKQKGRKSGYHNNCKKH